MAENQTPSINPADESSLVGVIRNAVRKELQGTDGMMPVEVVKYDRATNRAEVRHLIQMQGSDGEKVSRANVSSVRVMQPGTGAFNISQPIKPGDKGWILAADRDLSIFQQDVDKDDAPNTARMKSFQDSLFMPDAMKNGNAPAGEGDRVVLGANDGSAYISFDAGGIYIQAGGVRVEITGAGMTITGGRVEHEGKNIGATHTHGGIEPGGANTAVPNA